MLFYHNVARDQIFKLINKDGFQKKEEQIQYLICVFSIIQTQKCVAAFTPHCAENQIDFYRFILAINTGASLALTLLKFFGNVFYPKDKSSAITELLFGGEILTQGLLHATLRLLLFSA